MTIHNHSIIQSNQYSNMLQLKSRSIYMRTIFKNQILNNSFLSNKTEQTLIQGISWCNNLQIKKRMP